MPFIAAAIGGGAAIYGGIQQGNMARDQAGEGMLWTQMVRNMSAPSQKEQDELEAQLQFKEKALALFEEEIGRQQTIKGKIDPGLMSALDQMTQMIQGGSPTQFMPQEKERARLRMETQDRLAQQLGPDYMSSSLGQKILGQFDQETQMQRQGQIGALAGLTQQLGQPGLANMGIQGYTGLSQLSSNRFQNLGSIRTRQLNALMNTPTSQYQGAQYMTGIGIANAIGSAAGTYGGYQMQQNRTDAINNFGQQQRPQRPQGFGTADTWSGFTPIGG